MFPVVRPGKARSSQGLVCLFLAKKRGFENVSAAGTAVPPVLATERIRDEVPIAVGVRLLGPVSEKGPNP